MRRVRRTKRTVTYTESRDRFVAALAAAAEAQERGDVSAIEDGYDELDSLLPRGGGPEYDKLHVALHFWDGWIDARNHSWMYYEGISQADWPKLARGIVADLRADQEIQDERVCGRFDLHRVAQGGSTWNRLKARLRKGRAVEQ
jgi:hypothetical protein